MASVTSLSDLDLDDPRSTTEFLQLNAQDHIVIHNTLLEQGFITPASPLTYEKIDADFLRVNANECLAWARALSLSIPPSLSTVDPEDDKAMLGWFNDYQLFMDRVFAAVGL